MDKFADLVSRANDIGAERFKREYMNEPIGVSDGARLDEMHKTINRLQERINGYALTNMGLEATNTDLQKLNDELIKENQELRIEAEKIHSRFEILDI